MKKIISMMAVMALLVTGISAASVTADAAKKEEYTISFNVINNKTKNLVISGNKLKFASKAINSKWKEVKVPTLKLTKKTVYKVSGPMLGKGSTKMFKVSKAKMKKVMNEQYKRIVKYQVDSGGATIKVKGKTVLEISARYES